MSKGTGNNKGDIKLDKEEIKKPDAFLLSMEKSWSAVERYRSLIAGLVIVLLVGGLAYVLIDHLNVRAERKAGEELYKVEATYLKLKDQFERAKNLAMTPPTAEKDDKKDDDKPQPASGDLQKDYGTVVEGFEAFLKSQADTAAGAQAALMLGEIYLEYKQPEKAVAALQATTLHLKPKQLLFGLSHVMLGSAQAAQGNCEHAIGTWRKVLEAPESSYLHADLLVKSGLCYENLKQADKAVEAYRRVTQEFADTGAASSAKMFLRALEMRQTSTPTPTAG